MCLLIFHINTLFYKKFQDFKHIGFQKRGFPGDCPIFSKGSRTPIKPSAKSWSVHLHMFWVLYTTSLLPTSYSSQDISSAGKCYQQMDKLTCYCKFFIIRAWWFHCKSGSGRGRGGGGGGWRGLGGKFEFQPHHNNFHGDWSENIFFWRNSALW